MSNTSGGLVASVDLSKVGPDYFTFYACEVKELLSQNEDFLPFTTEFTGRREEVMAKVKIEPSSGSFFNNSVGVGLSGYRKERLNALLRQTLAALTPEVDEMLDPVIAMRTLQSQVRSRKLISGCKGAASEGEMGWKNPDKRIKISSSSTSIAAPTSPVSCGSSREGSGSKLVDSKYPDVALPGKGMSNVVHKHCAHCSTNTLKSSTNTLKCKSDREGKLQCNACGIVSKTASETHLGSNTSSGKGDEEGNGDLQFLLENDGSLVEEMIKKYSDQLSTAIGHMEMRLEELLDTVVSTCRPMTLTEKQQLRKLIQKLPPKNLNRVLEIVQRSKPVETQYTDEIFIDLEQEDNATLWRLYYYIEAVEKARKLSS